MLSPQALFRGIVSRVLPQANLETNEASLRQGRYGEADVLSVVRKSHLLADEGSYFVTNNAQTGILSAAAVAGPATAPTTPSLVIVNNDSASNPNAKRVYLDYVELLVTAAGVTATATQAKNMAVVIDRGGRYSSGGTNLTANSTSTNMDITVTSVAQAYFGNITTTAATIAARTLVGQRMQRLPVSATTVPDIINDRVRYEFGSVEQIPSIILGSVAATTLQPSVEQATIKLPPVVLGPGQSCLIYLWQLVAGGTYTTATTYIPEIGWWER
jgi:hypothetical protein